MADEKRLSSRSPFATSACSRRLKLVRSDLTEAVGADAERHGHAVDVGDERLQPGNLDDLRSLKHARNASNIASSTPPSATACTYARATRWRSQNAELL